MLSHPGYTLNNCIIKRRLSEQIIIIIEANAIRRTNFEVPKLTKNSKLVLKMKSNKTLLIAIGTS